MIMRKRKDLGVEGAFGAEGSDFNCFFPSQVNMWWRWYDSDDDYNDGDGDGTVMTMIM